MFGAAGLTGWGWLVIALVVSAVELIAPVTYFLWIGAAAGVTAIMVFIFPDMSWQAQSVLFSVLAVSSVMLSKRYLVKRQSVSEQPDLNRRAEQYIGRRVTLSEAIEQGVGKVRMDDSHWKVTGPDLPAGAEVRITGANGAVLTVEQVR